MSDTTCHMSISLDGFVAGPDQSRDNPLGKRGAEVHGGRTTLDIAPVLLGSGERILGGIETFGFEPAEVLHSPLTTHIRYRRIS